MSAAGLKLGPVSGTLAGQLQAQGVAVLLQVTMNISASISNAGKVGHRRGGGGSWLLLSYRAISTTFIDF